MSRGAVRAEEVLETVPTLAQVSPEGAAAVRIA